MVSLSWYLGAALRSWIIFASIAYFPTFLIHRGFDLIIANTVATLILLAGVAGQVVGGTLSDRYSRKEYSIIGMLLAIPLSSCSWPLMASYL